MTGVTTKLYSVGREGIFGEINEEIRGFVANRVG